MADKKVRSAPDIIQSILTTVSHHTVTPEYRFYPPRRWRVDYAIIDLKIAVEIEGGAYSGGRHVRGKGYIADMEKYNRATLEGWRVLRYTPQQIDDIIRDIKEIGEKHV